MNGLGQQGDYQRVANGLLSDRKFLLHLQRFIILQITGLVRGQLTNRKREDRKMDYPAFCLTAEPLMSHHSSPRQQVCLPTWQQLETSHNFLNHAREKKPWRYSTPSRWKIWFQINGWKYQSSQHTSKDIGAVHNGLSSPTQETAVHDAQPLHERPMVCPLQESGQDLWVSCLVQGTSELQLLSGCNDRPRCGQQTNHFKVNDVSSLGETEQAIKHSCDMQELRLWENAIVRQVSNLQA